ncbi:hypothetical protein GCM10022221_67430 [Actinocorallia aurea]
MPRTAELHQERISELTAALKTKSAEIAQFSNALRDETGNGQYVMSRESYTSYKTAIGEAEEIKAAIVTEQKAAGLFDFLEKPEGVPYASVDAAMAAGMQVKNQSLADLWLKSPAWADMVESRYNRLGQVTDIDASIFGLQTKAQGDVYSAMAGTITRNALGTVEDVGLLPRMIRSARVRDLFPKETTTAHTLWGIRQTGFINRAAMMAERVAADGVSPATGGPTDTWPSPPRSDITIAPFSVNVKSIRHVMYVHRDTLADEGRIRALIDRDLVDGIKRKEDEQLLYGDGEGENILGLTNTQGIQEYGGIAEPRTAQLRRAATRVLLAEFESTGVIMHPLDWEELELETDENGVYVLAVSIAMGGEKKVWRQPVVDTPACQQGTYVMGAWGQAAKVFDRESVSLQVSTENRDLWEKKVVSIMADERVALLVERPEAMVNGTFHAP